MITQKQALIIMTGLLIAVLLFHISILFQMIPYSIVWAGKLKTVEEMYRFESVSILINLFLLMLLLIKGNYIKHKIPGKLINGILWLFVVLFALNTVGNLMAKTLFEKVVFTPLTGISALLIWIILRTKKE